MHIRGNARDPYGPGAPSRRVWRGVVPAGAAAIDDGRAPVGIARAGRIESTR